MNDNREHGDVLICDSNAWRSFWVKRRLQKISKDSDVVGFYVRSFKDLLNTRYGISSVGTNNMYFLTVDLASSDDLAKLKAIRRKDRLGKMVLFVRNVEHLGVLLKNKIEVMDYREVHSSRREKNEVIDAAYEQLLTQIAFAKERRKLSENS